MNNLAILLLQLKIASKDFSVFVIAPNCFINRNVLKKLVQIGLLIGFNQLNIRKLLVYLQYLASYRLLQELFLISKPSRKIYNKLEIIKQLSFNNFIKDKA
jgi:ribosomal protein S8